MATTRTTLRSSLQRKTDNQLTSSTDQDTYLDLADKQVQSDWSQFDKAILRYAKDSASTDSSGILLMDVDFVELERLQFTDDRKIPRLDDIEDRYSRTGYYFAGWDSNNQKRQIVVVENGSAKASTTIEWFGMKLNLMGAGTSAEPSIPEEFRDLIALKAAELYFDDQGPSLISFAQKWQNKYIKRISEARHAYKSLDDEPRFASSLDPDAQGNSRTVVHVQ